MKVCLNIILATLLLWITSCNFSKDAKQGVKKTSSLKIVIDTASNFFPDSTLVATANNTLAANRIVFDSAYGTLVYIYDSIENGTISVTVQSLLDRIHSKNILLTRDTTIVFSKVELPNFENGSPDTLNIADLKPGEKVCITRSVNGCFDQYSEKARIQRNENYYQVDFLSKRGFDDNGLKVSGEAYQSFKDSLLLFQTSIIKFAKKKSRGLCTTTITYFIQKGNTVYNIFDGDCSEEINYNSLSNTIQSLRSKEL